MTPVLSYMFFFSTLADVVVETKIEEGIDLVTTAQSKIELIKEPMDVLHTTITPVASAPPSTISATTSAMPTRTAPLEQKENIRNASNAVTNV